MQLLLDTHVLLWWLDGGDELTTESRGTIAESNNTVWLRAVIVWECRIKQALGKLVILTDFAEVLEQQALQSCRFTPDTPTESLLSPPCIAIRSIAYLSLRPSKRTSSL